MTGLRLAAIDAGSNAIRFVVADFACSPDSAVGPLDPAAVAVPLDYSGVAKLRFPVRLGHGVFTRGSLDEGAMEEAVVAFCRFRAEMERLGVDAHRAVATSAVREADNRDRFLDRIYRESDIVLEPISGCEEARLVHLAASRRVDFSRSRWVLVDLGGGSVEVVNREGDLSGVTTTSGLAWKIPGRVGDSPIVGAGLYVDNDVGACGSTGRGEAVIKTCGSHSVVELMRAGMAPLDACLEALRRVVRFSVAPRLRDEQGRPNFNVNYYAVNKNGEYGGAAIWSGASFAVCVAGEARHEDSAYLFERGG